MENNNPDTVAATDATPKGVTQTDPLAANTDTIGIAPEPADTDDQDMAGKLKAARDESAKRRMKVKELTEQVDALTAENSRLRRDVLTHSPMIAAKVRADAIADMLATLSPDDLNTLYEAANLTEEARANARRDPRSPDRDTIAQADNILGDVLQRRPYYAAAPRRYSTPELARAVDGANAQSAPARTRPANPLARAISR